MFFSYLSLLLMLSSDVSGDNQNPPSPISSNQISPSLTNEKEESSETNVEVTEKSANQQPVSPAVDQSSVESEESADQSEKHISVEKPPLPARKPPLPEKPLVLPKPVLLPKPEAPMDFG